MDPALNDVLASPALDPSRPPAEATLSPEEIARRASSGAVKFAGRSVLVRGVGLLTYLVFARLLSPAEFGTLSVGLSLTFLGGFLADAGFGPAFIQMAQEPDRRDLGALAGMQLAVVVGLLLVPIGGWVLLSGFSLISSVSWLYAASLLPVALRTPALILLERVLDFDPSIWMEIAETVVFAVLAVAAVAAGLGPAGVAGASVAKTLIGTLVLHRRVPDLFAVPNRHLGRLRPFLGFALKTQGQPAVSLGRDQLINYATVAIGGLGVLGIWSLTSRVMLLPGILFGALWRISYPAFARMRDAGRDIGPVLSRSVRLMSVLTPPTLIPLAIGAPLVLPDVLGQEWSRAGDLLPLLCLAVALSVPISTAGNGLLMARGEAGFLLWTVICLSAVFLVVGLSLVPALGATGLAVGFAAGGVVDSVMLTRALNRRLGLRLHRDHVPPLLFAVAAYAVGRLLADALADPWLGAVAGTSAGLLLFGAAVACADRAAVQDAARIIRQVFGRALPSAA